MTRPTFSIVTPTLDADRHLEQTIQSVLSQDYLHAEFLVQDGDSSDGTAAILTRYDERLSGCTSEPDRGQADAINRALRRCSGDILAWINADDFYEPGAFAHAADALIANPGASAVVGAAWMAFPDGTRTRRRPTDLSRSGLLHWRENWFAQPAVFFRRDAWERVGPLDESLGWAFDLDLWLRLSEIGPLVPIDAVLATFREHPASKTFSGVEHVRVETARVITRHASPTELADLFARQHNELARIDDVCAELLVEKVRHCCAGIEGDVVLFGAGSHTPWLLGVLKGRWRGKISAILDDRAEPGNRIASIPVIQPTSLVEPPRVIILSSDTLGAELSARARELFGDSVCIVDLYEGLPPGPYPKAAAHRAGWIEEAATTPPVPVPASVIRDTCRTRA